MTNTQDDCRRAFEKWYNDFPVGGRAAKEGLAWTAWQAAWSSRPQPNVEELVRRIQLRIENNEDENEGLHGLKGAFESGRSEGLDDAITIIRKWQTRGNYEASLD